MTTTFMTLNCEKQELNKTVFEKQITPCSIIEETTWSPDQFKNVLYIGSDKDYGDVFKAWDDDENYFFIFFGTAGDEFKK